ncbi:MAG: hypothetical protein GY799_29555 [Desulfobulbaceae bacterium]|nr:hypothetical protein [Desulfobulbaceae bacterium]
MSLWTKNIGTEKTDIEAAIREWSEILGDVTGEEIKHGLDTWDSEYPPNVYQFRTTCMAMRRRGSHKLFAALPKPQFFPAIARQALKAMRSGVKK